MGVAGDVLLSIFPQLSAPRGGALNIPKKKGGDV